MGEFADKVFQIVSQVPYGKVTTYGQVARLMGRPRSARYVGFALRTNPSPSADGGTIPCHRVLFADGSLCRGFAFGGPGVQRDMLLAEGIEFLDEEHVDLSRHLWDGNASSSSCPNSARDCHPERSEGSPRNGSSSSPLQGDSSPSAQNDKAALFLDGLSIPPCDEGPLEPPEDFDWERELGDE